jgi:uncharacterized membrane protein YqiK
LVSFLGGGTVVGRGLRPEGAFVFAVWALASGERFEEVMAVLATTWVWLPLLLAFGAWLVLRYIPNDEVGVVEKLWSAKGSVREGHILALFGEAGYQADLLRGGIHFGYWRWQYAVHRVPLVTIPQGKIGYVYARDGESLLPTQTLGQIVDCNDFQDARRFVLGEMASTVDGVTQDCVIGQRGRQRAILREGVYAINPAVFVVIAQHKTFALSHLYDKNEWLNLLSWQAQLNDIDGFDPVLIGGMQVEVADGDEPRMTSDTIGIVTTHDGPSLPPNEIIAPVVDAEVSDANYHNNYQDPEAFLRAGGRRGRQYQPLIDGTYFINRWFATVEVIPKTVVPIGHVGVVVSYYGARGRDLSGDRFRHGERVQEGERGVWEQALGPGKYPFNTYAGNIILVPTTNFVLHWVTGKTESHRYDESLKSIDLVTKDAYEPLLPLSVVVHIDYQRAPNVIQRFGDVQRLITQTLDPMLSAYFRDIAHKKTMLQLLQERDLIQNEAREELRRKFSQFDMECVDVLIGKPSSEGNDTKIETLLEQLRQRQLSFEQMETYERQCSAAEKRRTLAEAEATAKMQTELTNARVQAQIAEQHGEAELARARKQAEQSVVMADAELARSRRQAEQTVVLAEADAQRRTLDGRGESQRVMQVGLSEAAVLLQKIASFGDPRLYAMSQVSAHMAQSKQPLVPERVFVSGAVGGDGESQLGPTGGLLGTLISLLVAEKSAFAAADTGNGRMKQFADRMTDQVLGNLEEVAKTATQEALAKGLTGEPATET